MTAAAAAAAAAATTAATTSINGPGNSSRSSPGQRQTIITTTSERLPLHHEQHQISHHSTMNTPATTTATITTRQTIDGVSSHSHSNTRNTSKGTPAAPPPPPPLPQTATTIGGSSNDIFVASSSGGGGGGSSMISRPDSYSVHSQLSGSAAGFGFGGSGGGGGGGSSGGGGPTGGGDWPNWPVPSSPTTPLQQQQQVPYQTKNYQQHLNNSPGGGRENGNVDPDDQEQALFEQRLCEDIYGVAVRKINQNGKSNLRYVKCSYFDTSDFLHHLPGTGNSSSNNNNSKQSSSRSVSSRHSRSGLSRFLSGGSNSSGRDAVGASGSVDRNTTEPHRTILVPHQHPSSSTAGGGHDKNNTNSNNNLHRPSSSSTKIRALAWGKKNLVKIPLDKFVVVRKGKTTDRTKRNPCPSSRILSLITNDPIHQSLDIEAPTRLDRDKFARAFARFLRIPLEGEATNTSSTAPPAGSPVAVGAGQHRQYVSTNNSNVSIPTPVTSVANQPPSALPNGPGSDMRSVRSDLTYQSSLKGKPFGSHNGPNSVTNSSIPDAAMTTTNSYATNNSGSRRATNGSTGAVGTNGSRPPSSSNKALRSNKSKKPSTSNDLPVFFPPPASSSSHNRNPIENDTADQQISAFPSPSNHDDMGFPKLDSEKQQKTSSTPQGSESVQIIANDDDDASVVSSITGGGFDQDLVEELHLALEKMKTELQESRAEAARAVKVAEQAIQSAENSSSKDWNSTVTHKAAEAAAAAQKRSAEAIAKARIAEEKLQVERKNAAMWKKQVEAAEEQAGHWQTRAAAAEVQRFSVAEALESERKRNAQLAAAMSSSSKEEKQDAFDPFDSFHSSTSVASPKKEIDRLRSKLAMESARRRKLLGELQDLRGSVRVYCRLEAASKSSTVALASNEVLMLQRQGLSNGFKNSSIETAQVGIGASLSFEFDGILTADMDQKDVYAEFESVCSSVVEGFKICVMTFGASTSCKTLTMIGDIVYHKNHIVSIKHHGIQLQSMKQLFSLLEHRRDRYQDTVTMTLIEVHDEKIFDLMYGTEVGDARGRVEGARRSSSTNRRRIESEDGNLSQQANSIISSSRTKLEIKTNRDGETVVHGVISVEVRSFEDFCRVWSESLSRRSKRLSEQDIDPQTHQVGSHFITNLKVVSRNIGTGVSTTGRIQFVDFAAADMASPPFRTTSSMSPSTSPSSDDLDKRKFANKSLNTLDEVVKARSQFQQSIPYRNSTITHLISDSLEADTKTVMIACVNPNESEIRNTTGTLQFAQEMRKVVVGKATRHTNVPASF